MRVDLAKTQHYLFMMPQVTILKPETTFHCKAVKPFLSCGENGPGPARPTVMGSQPWQGRAPTPGGRRAAAHPDCCYGHQSDLDLKQHSRDV